MQAIPVPASETAGAPAVRGGASRLILPIAFLAYLAASGITMARHELSGDEVHSWNIVKASATYPELVRNIRYEGHPPLWYTLQWPLSRLTRDPAVIQVLHWAIASATAFLILFRSPFPLPTRILIPFGYFFLFEYAALSRNYAIGVLLGCVLCLRVCGRREAGTFLYYLLLFGLSICHLLAVVLAASLHVAVLAQMAQRRRKTNVLIGHALLGALVLLPALYFIFPPADSALNVDSWREKWSAEQLKALVQIPLRAFLPVPAWWNHNFWNTQALIEERLTHPALRFVNLLVAALLVGTAVSVLRRHTPGLLLFLTNLGLTLAIAATAFPLTTSRHSGFLAVAFLLTFWLRSAEEPATRGEAAFVHALLAVAVAGGVFSAWKDVRLPFSNLLRIVELEKEVPPGSRLVTDYWTMEAHAAFVDTPITCVDLGRALSFNLWDRSLAEALRNEARYSMGFREIFRRDGPKAVYMVSLDSPEKLARVDLDFMKRFRVALLDRRDGAIDPGGNLYLYRIENNPAEP